MIRSRPQVGLAKIKFNIFKDECFCRIELYINGKRIFIKRVGSKCRDLNNVITCRILETHDKNIVFIACRQAGAEFTCFIAWYSFVFLWLLKTISSLFNGCLDFISIIEPSIFASLGKFKTGVCAFEMVSMPFSSNTRRFFFIR